MVLTLHFYVVYGSQNEEQLLPYTILSEWFFITEVESVYYAVRNESLHKTDMLKGYSDRRSVVGIVMCLKITCVYIYRPKHVALLNIRTLLSKYSCVSTDTYFVC